MVFFKRDIEKKKENIEKRGLGRSITTKKMVILMESRFEEVNSFMRDVNLSQNCLDTLENLIKMDQLDSHELKKILYRCQGIKRDMENLISLIKPKLRGVK